ncbi:DUF998 domain-containing protein [Flaviaesturariibacter flavus]|uniref:DUF998 domain-containing protein n=1 Tax=Flaviaesturariibacter flavus TaxID=2502780 RepID=A0A4R1BNG7_9BACT|nr:DUF998 domain-containing protein [Flaviaesturariibacter flavus]TCJ19084.1 DUF998 domain-containing protein [Flaviaesturariibacter flavus]
MQLLFTQPAQPASASAETHQPGWKRALLLGVLAYEGAGALLGGALLVASPDGSRLRMPVSMLRGAFEDFLIPGIVLLLMGVLNSVAFIAVLKRWRRSWIAAVAALVGLLIWFWIEIAVLLRLHWLHAMWGLPVVLGLYAAVPLIPRDFLRKGQLWCGIISSLLYAVINVIVPYYWEGYHWPSQVISELSAVNAPTRALWSVLAAPYTFLVLAFAWGVVRSAGENRRLRTAGWLLVAYCALGFLWPFAPMHLRTVLAAGGGNFSDTLHLALGAATELLYLLALGFVAAALGWRFRVYSVLTFLLLLVFGFLTFRESPQLARNGATPMIGVWERINIFLFLTWMSVLAVIMLRGVRETVQPHLQAGRLPVSGAR